MGYQNHTGKVLYPGKSGYIESDIIIWKDSFSIKIEKGSSVPIACYPSGCLKPAGIILALESDNIQNLQLKWSDGFLADLLLELMNIGVPTEQINIPRLAKEITDRCEGDPWSIDRELLMDAIKYDVLTIYKIKTGSLQDITIPVQGTWVSDNPFFPSVISDFQGELLLKGIYPGLHRFQNPETKVQLDILVNDDSYEYLVY